MLDKLPVFLSMAKDANLPVFLFEKHAKILGKQKPYGIESFKFISN
jgi:hypothetical protein